MHQLFPFLLALIHPLSTDAFSASSTAPLRRIATTRAELLVSVGRIPGTAMPPEWAASGAKLGFALEVEFTEEPPPYETSKEHMLKGDALMGSTLLSVEPLNEPTFVSSSGTQQIPVGSGAYGCRVQGLESEQCALRFFLDFPDGAKRNDVELPAERVYFLTSCWLSPEALERVTKRRGELAREIDLTNARANKIRSQQLEKNILGNAIQRAFNLRHLIVLADRRDKLQRQLDEAEQAYPADSTGVIHGPNDVTYAKEGVIAVKRMKGAIGTKEQYWYVGSFTINQFFEDE
mmetsp:Transcript_27744/g.52273  ORF Transcript_27744/g.52273 Transcript_27744/m.52273 type:complete len:291 (-) Transcript_27744:327-1199(-)